jgi:hypothetical protein
VAARRRVEIPEQETGSGDRDPPSGVHRHVPHPRQVQQDPAVADRVAGDAVATAATDSARSFARAYRIPAATSAVSRHRRITAGRRSIMALNTARASS